MIARFGISALKSSLSKRVLASVQPARRISHSVVSRGDHHNEPKHIIVGPGGKTGEVPTDLEQAAGHERLELLASLEGREFWDMTPPTMTHLGTKKNPVVVESTDTYRYVACTGFPVDSHDTIWLTLESKHEVDRCPECGSCFKLKQIDYPEIPQGALLEHHEKSEPEKLA